MLKNGAIAVIGRFFSLLKVSLVFQNFPGFLLSIIKLKYSRVRLRVYAWVTRFTFSAAISKSLELKRSSIAL